MNGSIEVRSALADLDSVALTAEEVGMALVAHTIRRAVRTLRAELVPVVTVLDEDDGDLLGEWIDPTFIVRPS